MSKNDKKESKNERGVESRRQALSILTKIESDKAYANIALSKALDKSQLSKRDKAFVTCLVQGVVRNKGAIDNKINKVSKRHTKKMNSVLLNTLRIGIFQLDFLDDVPPSAILNTSTTLARKCGHEGLAKYTTAILRSHLRNKEKDDKPKETDNRDLSLDQLAQDFSMPEWIVSRWLKNYGYEETKQLLSHSLSKPDIFLRPNHTAVTTEALINVLKSNGIKAEESKIIPDCVKVNASKKQKGGFESFPGYEEGLFSVQDASAALVSLIVAPQNDEYVIDLCAAPGGKTLHMSELMDNTGKILAVDIYQKRLNLLSSSMTRLGLDNIKVSVQDATKFTSEKLADRILIDAPCSGSGVFNRRSDSKYNRKEEDLEELCRLQKKLIENAAQFLKPGGVLVYSTCSVEPEENTLIVDWFQKNHTEFQFDDISSLLPPKLAEHPSLSVTAGTGKIQLLPSIYNLSGFFIARLVKSSP